MLVLQALHVVQDSHVVCTSTSWTGVAFENWLQSPIELAGLFNSGWKCQQFYTIKDLPNQFQVNLNQFKIYLNQFQINLKKILKLCLMHPNTLLMLIAMEIHKSLMYSS